MTTGIDRESVMAARAERLAGLDQSLEARKERAMAAVNRTLAPRITAIRVIGPLMPFLSEQFRHFHRNKPSDFVVGKCVFCNPEPEWFKCVLCDWETPDKWRMKLHTDLNPKWCQDRAKKKIRKWAQHA